MPAEPAATYAFEPSPRVTLPVAGSTARFPVHRIYCVGRNYAEHAIEMGHDPNREPPFFFQKNPDNLRVDGRFPYPPASKDVHHEIELVVALSGGGADIAESAALDLVYGYAVGIDLTKRDRQADAKAKGQPWERAKAFEASAPITPIVPAERIGHPKRGAIELAVNGEMRQHGDLADMILPVPAIIARLSEVWSLAPGDLIYTGTPEGVGRIARGDFITARVDGVARIEVEIA